jgi:hypothetical protein
LEAQWDKKQKEKAIAKEEKRKAQNEKSKETAVPVKQHDEDEGFVRLEDQFREGAMAMIWSAERVTLGERVLNLLKRMSSFSVAPREPFKYLPKGYKIDADPVWYLDPYGNALPIPCRNDRPLVGVRAEDGAVFFWETTEDDEDGDCRDGAARRHAEDGETEDGETEDPMGKIRRFEDWLETAVRASKEEPTPPPIPSPSASPPPSPSPTTAAKSGPQLCQDTPRDEAERTDNADLNPLEDFADSQMQHASPMDQDVNIGPSDGPFGGSEDRGAINNNAIAELVRKAVREREDVLLAGMQERISAGISAGVQAAVAGLGQVVAGPPLPTAGPSEDVGPLHVEVHRSKKSWDLDNPLYTKDGFKKANKARQQKQSNWRETQQKGVSRNVHMTWRSVIDD